MMMTDEKVSAVTSWLNDILFTSDEKPWSIKPTPSPELTPDHEAEIINIVKQEIIEEVQEEARGQLIQMIQSGQIQDRLQAEQFILQMMEQRAAQVMQERADEIAEDIRAELEKAAKEARDRVETALHDVLVESGWEDALSDAIEDIATFPAGIVKGPILRRKKKLKWKRDFNPDIGTGMDEGYQGMNYEGSPAEVVSEVSIDFTRVSPFDIYPFPNAKKPEDGIIERLSLTRNYLYSLIGVPGYDEEAIRMVLRDYGQGAGGWLSVSIDQQRQELENRPNEDRSPEIKIDALQLWGSIQGLMLLQHGLSPDQITDPFAEYSVEIIVIGRYVIKAELNGDPLGRVPYNFASFRKRNGSLWGDGVPHVMKDSQDAANAAARSLINNMAISSGPQVNVDIAQLPPGENVKELYPWKIWQSNSDQALGGSSQGRPPVSFFVPPSIASELIAVYKFFSEEADNKVGVPKYSYGGAGGGGALGTATGFSMMMGNAARGIKTVVKHIDKGITKPTVERTHQFKVLFFRDPEFWAGDIKILARGSEALVAKEQAAVRRNELLQIVVTAPPVYELIGKAGLASMLREIFKGADFKDSEIVPTKKEVLAREEEEKALMEQQQQALLMAQAGGGQGGGPPLLEQGTETNQAGAKVSGKDFQTV